MLHCFRFLQLRTFATFWRQILNIVHLTPLNFSYQLFFRCSLFNWTSISNQLINQLIFSAWDKTLKREVVSVVVAAPCDVFLDDPLSVKAADSVETTRSPSADTFCPLWFVCEINYQIKTNQQRFQPSERLWSVLSSSSVMRWCLFSYWIHFLQNDVGLFCCSLLFYF